LLCGIYPRNLYLFDLPLARRILFCRGSFLTIMQIYNLVAQLKTTHKKMINYKRTIQNLFFFHIHKAYFFRVATKAEDFYSTHMQPAWVSCAAISISHDSTGAILSYLKTNFLLLTLGLILFREVLLGY
jgi:hypothetical protein